MKPGFKEANTAMPDRHFYVEASKGKEVTGYLPAQFLMRNGAYVMNPTPGGSQRETIYSDHWGNNGMSGSEANPNNYLIVPSNYTELKARDFAAGIKKIRDTHLPGSDMVAVLAMANAFTQGGSQDLQRHPQWGVPKGSAVKAFVGGASNHLGFVTGCRHTQGMVANWRRGCQYDQRRRCPTWQEVVSP
jgi:hypothetical protein